MKSSQCGGAERVCFQQFVYARRDQPTGCVLVAMVKRTGRTERPRERGSWATG
jgi:hypothetical protein